MSRIDNREIHSSVSTCVQSVCSPDTPELCLAGRQTEWESPNPNCTSSPGGMTEAAENTKEWMSKWIFCEFMLPLLNWHRVNQKVGMLTWSYLPQSAELHDDPHGVLCDHSDQLDDMRMVELTHRYCETNVHALIRRWNVRFAGQDVLDRRKTPQIPKEHPYGLLVGTFLWRCLMCSFCRSW